MLVVFQNLADRIASLPLRRLGAGPGRCLARAACWSCCSLPPTSRVPKSATDMLFQERSRREILEDAVAERTPARGRQPVQSGEVSCIFVPTSVNARNRRPFHVAYPLRGSSSSWPATLYGTTGSVMTPSLQAGTRLVSSLRRALGSVERAAPGVARSSRAVLPPRPGTRLRRSPRRSRDRNRSCG